MDREDMSVWAEPAAEDEGGPLYPLGSGDWLAIRVTMALAVAAWFGIIVWVL